MVSAQAEEAAAVIRIGARNATSAGAGIQAPEIAAAAAVLDVIGADVDGVAAAVSTTTILGIGRGGVLPPGTRKPCPYTDLEISSNASKFSIDDVSPTGCPRYFFLIAPRTIFAERVFGSILTKRTSLGTSVFPIPFTT